MPSCTRQEWYSCVDTKIQIEIIILWRCQLPLEYIHNLDPLMYPRCKGTLRIISFIEDPSVIREILLHLGLWFVRSRLPLKIHDPPNREYATADFLIQPHTDTIYGDPECSWDDYIQS